MDNPADRRPQERAELPLPPVVSGPPPEQQQSLVGMFRVAPIDVEWIAERVYQLICQDLRLERERGDW